MKKQIAFDFIFSDQTGKEGWNISVRKKGLTRKVRWSFRPIANQKLTPNHREIRATNNTKKYLQYLYSYFKHTVLLLKIINGSQIMYKTIRRNSIYLRNSRSPCGSVDWNVLPPPVIVGGVESLPLRERGLKLFKPRLTNSRHSSLPLRERGLKQGVHTA